MDLALLRRLLAELQPQLVGSRTDRVYAVPRYDIVLGSSSRRRHLWLSLDPEDPHICARATRPKSDQRPPAFAMAARKWGRGRRVTGLDLVNEDRVVRIDWEGGGALVAELVPRRATAFVLDANDVVIAIWNPRQGRPEVGDVYSPPERAARGDVADLSASDWVRMATLDDRQIGRELMQNVHAMSPSTVAEIIFRWRRGDGELSELTGAEVERVQTDGPPTIYSAAALDELREPVGASKLLLSPCPLEHRGHACARTFESIAEACAYFYDLRALLRLGHQVRGAVQRAIDDRLDRLRRRQTALPAADAADRSAALRRRADLLLAAPGALVVDGIVGVADVYGDGTPVQLQVDPTLDLAANAQKLYRRAQRIEAQAERAGAARARSEAQAADFDQLAQATRAMRTPAEIESVIEAALKAGLKLPLERLRIAEAGTGHLLNELAPKTTVPGGGILHVTTSEGYEILIGRNAINNDRLTHKVADRHDWWLHAEGPGSHVVLRNPRRLEQPPPDALVAAAALAAWFSKARSAAKVEVRWTQARRVRKPRGAPAGTALLDKFHSFVVAPRPPAEVAAETAPRRS